MAERKYLSHEGLQEYDALIKEKIDSGDQSILSSSKSYTDQEVAKVTNGTIVVKEATHASTADSATSAGSATKATQDASGNVITSTYETKSDATAKLNEAKSYTDTKTSGMATTTVVDNKISAHNTSTTAHSDIRDLISELSTKVSNFLDVDDATTDQLSEVLTLISNNKGTLDSLTSGKVNVSDIVDNLTTSSATKVLSANQGVALKALIDTLQEAVDGKADNREFALGNSGLVPAPMVLGGVAKTLFLRADGSWEEPPTYTHPDSGVAAGTYRSVTVNTQGHVTGGSNPTTLSGYGITDAYTKTQVDSALSGKAASSHSHSAATTSAAGFMSAADKTKLEGIATGATKITVDTALSTTSTNPVRNSIVTTAINSATSAISANTSSISSHSTAIQNLQTAVGEIQDITSEEIKSLFSN